MWKLNAPENIDLEFPVPEDISDNKTPPKNRDISRRNTRRADCLNALSSPRRISSQTTKSHREYH
ncbi:hypothetical protein DPMN_016360 [Dreissena polymorpha]|uniref:Uncharacterized protein n=1 Tax=Dreissena polymorpha TaxID=45954 RepID=A0A9D4S6D3_DREPO|nr:hypothetical protein DPMN_016360 [Dreissena polymorpha]